MRQRVIVFAALIVLMLGTMPPFVSRAASRLTVHKDVLILTDKTVKTSFLDSAVQLVSEYALSHKLPVRIRQLGDFNLNQLNQYHDIVYIQNGSTSVKKKNQFYVAIKRSSVKFLQIGGGVPDAFARFYHLRLVSYPSLTGQLSIGHHSSGMDITMSATHFIQNGVGEKTGVLKNTGERTLYTGIVSSNKNFAYLSELDDNDEQDAVAVETLGTWLHCREKDDGKIFLTLKDITPFSDYRQLTDIAQALYKQGIPYIAVVQPVTANFNSAAMTRYAQQLYFLQSHGASIIVGAPFVYRVDVNDHQLLKQLMKEFVDQLIANHVAPLGFSSPNYWLFDEGYREESLNHFHVFLPQSNLPPLMWRRVASTAQPVTSLIVTIPLKEALTSSIQTYYSTPPINYGLTISVNQLNTAKRIESFVNQLKNSNLSFNDLSHDPMSATTYQHEIQSDGWHVTIDDQSVTNQPYRHWQISRSEQIKKKTDGSRNVIIVFFTLILFVFLILLVIGRYIYIRKYLRR